MNTLDLNSLQRFTAAAVKLQNVARELQPFLETLKEFDGKDIVPIPTDRLIRAGEAAQILGVNQSTIGAFVKAGLLKPLYVNSDQKKFWLSQVKALPRTKPWTLKENHQ